MKAGDILADVALEPCLSAAVGTTVMTRAYFFLTTSRMARSLV